MCPLWHWRATLIAWDTSFRKHLGPRELRILGRRVLDSVAPEVADEQKRRRWNARRPLPPATRD
jgi:hypothetical protein